MYTPPCDEYILTLLYLNISYVSSSNLLHHHSCYALRDVVDSLRFKPVFPHKWKEIFLTNVSSTVYYKIGGEIHGQFYRNTLTSQVVLFKLTSSQVNGFFAYDFITRDLTVYVIFLFFFLF